MKVLIVDDEVIVAKALERAFKAQKHDVRVAHSAIAALEEWEKQKPDVVLLDVIMPGLTGPQLLQEIQSSGKKTLLSDVKIIFMSAHSTVKNRASAEELGGHAFIQKPFENIFDLVEKVQTLST